jgi:hypothetical protein
VAEIERLAGFSLPADFRAFLAQTNAVVGISVHNGYWLGGVEPLMQWPDPAKFPRTIDGVQVIPVATDGGGNAFLLGASGCVWRWGHETGKVLQVADSFEAFLQRVVDDWEAYVSDKRGWQFLV